MVDITQTYHIDAPVYAVWKALVDPKIIDRWGGGPAAMSDKEGKEFSLWGGDIHGKNIKVIKGKELVQEWFGGKWETPSIVTFALGEENGVTTVILYHRNIPDNEAKDIEDGWRQYYLGPLKKLLEIPHK